MTLRLAAQFADMWNGGSGSAETFQRKSAVLDQWCLNVGRDPAAIERSISVDPAKDGNYDQYVAAGAQHIILMLGSPWDLKPVEQLVRWRDTAQ